MLIVSYRSKKIPIAANFKVARVRKTMCNLWTNFAKYDNPTPSNQKSEFVWSPIKHVYDNNSPFNLDYLNITVERIGMQRNPQEDRMKFWRGIFDKYNDGFIKAKL